MRCCQLVAVGNAKSELLNLFQTLCSDQSTGNKGSWTSTGLLFHKMLLFSISQRNPHRPTKGIIKGRLRNWCQMESSWSNTAQWSVSNLLLCFDIGSHISSARAVKANTFDTSVFKLTAPDCLHLCFYTNLKETCPELHCVYLMFN